ncbi:putative reverse transcriptase domain, viral movement protein, partial [Tanacetum coccineum]
YGYIKNHKKTVKNKQARTRESEENKKKPKKSKPKPEIQRPQSNPVNMVNNTMVKAQRGVGFALNTLTQLAQAVTSKNDSLAIRGAVLLVQDNNNKRHICGYKSVTFKASEQHYHSTFKEILAVKRGIEKFQVEMDMFSFPCMLQFKRKMLPHAKLLRWSNWFSQWKFIVKHIKGIENVLADFLSRPKANKSEENYPKEASEVQKHTPHLLSMVFSVASHKEKGPSSTPTPPIPVFDLLEEIVETIGDLTFEKRAKLCYKMFLNFLLKNHGLCIKGLKFHPNYPFLNIFHIHDLLETSDDDDDARSLWSSDDDEHLDPFKDDPIHPDARWSP